MKYEKLSAILKRLEKNNFKPRTGEGEMDNKLNVLGKKT